MLDVKIWAGADVVFLSEVVIMGALVERVDGECVGTKVLVLTISSTVLSVGYPVGAIILSVPKPLAVVGSSVGNA